MIEQFWNTVYYFAYKFDGKASFCFLKFMGVFKLYDAPFMRKRFKTKFGIEDPVKYLVNVNTNFRVGANSIVASFVMQAIIFVFLFALQIIYLYIFIEMPTPEEILFPIVFWGILSGCINYSLLFRKDKYVQYFKKFEKQPREWKVKWAWISAGVILFPFVLLVGVLMVI